MHTHVYTGVWSEFSDLAKHFPKTENARAAVTLLNPNYTDPQKLLDMDHIINGFDSNKHQIMLGFKTENKKSPGSYPDAIALFENRDVMLTGIYASDVNKFAFVFITDKKGTADEPSLYLQGFVKEGRRTGFLYDFNARDFLAAKGALSRNASSKPRRTKSYKP